MERRKFTREFKLVAVRLIRDRGVVYARASQDLKVHPTQLAIGSGRLRAIRRMRFPAGVGEARAAADRAEGAIEDFKKTSPRVRTQSRARRRSTATI